MRKCKALIVAIRIKLDVDGDWWAAEPYPFVRKQFCSDAAD